MHKISKGDFVAKTMILCNGESTDDVTSIIEALEQFFSHDDKPNVSD